MISGTPARIVVTGGAGFIGAHSVRRLAGEGLAVLVIDDLRHACGEPLPSDVDLVQADVNAPAMADEFRRFRPDAVLHLAAQGGVSRSMRDPAADATTNVLGTVAVLKAATDGACRRVVFASSGGAIYGQAPRLPTSERTVPRPLSPYGAAKLAAEGYLAMFSRTTGFSTLALRYSNVYGPLQDGTGEAGVVAISCERLLAGRAPVIRGDGEQTRDFVFVDDVVEANVRALRSNLTGTLNIGTGIQTSVRSVVGVLMMIAGYRGQAEMVAGPPGEVRHTALDIRRARRALNWAAATPLDDGLGRTFRSFQERAQRRPPAASARAAEGAARRDPGLPSESG